MPDLEKPKPELAQSMLESLTDGVSIVDEHGVHVWVNDAFCDMVGFSREEMIGAHPPHPYWCPENIDAISDAFADTLGGEPSTYELHFRHKDRGAFPAMVSAFQFDSGGNRYYAATVKDMSAPERLSEDVTQTEQLVETMLRGGDVSTWDWPLPDGIPTVSDSHFTMLGFEPDAWVPSFENWKLRVHPDDLDAALESLDDLLNDRTRVYAAELRMKTADGGWRWLLARGYVTERDDEGNPTRVTGTHVDIHTMKLQEQKLRQLQKMEVLGQLTAGIAHDFNNVLAIVYGSLEILRLTAEERQRDSLENAFHSLDRARNLTRSLLNMTRVDSAGATQVNAFEVIIGMLSVLRSATSDTCELGFGSAAGVLPIRVDRALLENALTNLVLNAKDALAESGGRIDIHCEPVILDATQAEPLNVKPGEFCVLRVTDNGCGMSESVFEMATEPLFTTKPVGRGTGLGLAMVKRLADEASGFLEIESTEGEGTTVQLGFPLLSASFEEDEDQVPAIEADGKTVLVVDDESELLDIVASQLERLGYNVIKVGNPRRALSEIQGRHVDLLLTDVAMPYTIDGVELARRAMAIRDPLSVLFMTGYADEAVTRKAAKMGPVLYKPFGIDRLAQYVKKALDEDRPG